MVRVKTLEEVGAWGEGSVFKTSEGHAKRLEAKGLVQIVDHPSSKIRRRLEDAVSRSGKTTREDLMGQLEWPNWLKDSQLDSLDEADVTPSQALDMSPSALQEKVPGIGPKSCAMLQRDLDLQWTALRVDYDLES